MARTCCHVQSPELPTPPNLCRGGVPVVPPLPQRQPRPGVVFDTAWRDWNPDQELQVAAGTQWKQVPDGAECRNDCCRRFDAFRTMQQARQPQAEGTDSALRNRIHAKTLPAYAFGAALAWFQRLNKLALALA